MSIKDTTGTVVIVLTVIALYAALAYQSRSDYTALAAQSRSEFTQTTREIGDLRERITRVETVIVERLPVQPVKRSTGFPQPPTQ